MRNSKPINVLSPKFRTEEILDEIKECLNKGWTGMGFKTVELEEEWEKYTGLENSHYLSSNTVGLHLAVKILKDKYDWQPNDEVITTPLTFVSTNHAIMYESLKPVFCDVDSHLSLDPQSLLELITPKTKCVMFVGIGGNPGNLNQISEICEEHNIKLILDAAHMSGTYVKDPLSKFRHVGKEADISVFSFQAVKNLPTADSGMICFKSSELLEKCKKLSWLGIDKDTYSRSQEGQYKWKYDIPHVGFKYHGNSIMAAIGLVQLKYLDEDNDYRNTLSDYYLEKLSDYFESELLKEIPVSDFCYKSSRHLFQVRVLNNKRNSLMEFFYQENIFPGVHYIDNRNYPMYKSDFDTCPNATIYSEEIISLPLHLNMNEADIDRVVSVIQRFFN